MPDNIVAPRVPLTDPRTGLIAREWYLFFFALYDLVLSGNNTSIADLQVGPGDDGLLPAIAEVVKAIQALGVAPRPTTPDAVLTKALQGLAVAPPTLDTLALTKALQGLAVVPDVGELAARLAEVQKAVQALQVAPVAAPTLGGILVGSVTATLNFGNTVAGACSDLTITVPGAVDGDAAQLVVPNGSVPANGSFFAWVSGADTVTARYTNNDLVTAYNPASGTFRAVVTRY